MVLHPMCYFLSLDMQDEKSVCKGIVWNQNKIVRSLDFS